MGKPYTLVRANKNKRLQPIEGEISSYESRRRILSRDRENIY